MSGLRRKRANQSSSSSGLKQKKPHRDIDFALHNDNDNSDEDDGDNSDIIDSDDNNDHDDNVASSDEDEHETVDAKRIRMAREYLSKMEQAEDSDDSNQDDDSDDDDGDRLSRKLEKQRLKQQGMYQRRVASKVAQSVHSWWDESPPKSTSPPHPKPQDQTKSQAQTWIQQGHVKLCRGHDLTPTCVALHAPSGSIAYSASKDNSILMWDVDKSCKTQTIVPQWNPHTCNYTRNSGEVLAMVASDDHRYLAVGGRDATVKIYDVRLQNHNRNSAATLITTDQGNHDGIRGIVTTFEGHKGPVTSLAFRSQSLQLFSGSDDRCIRHYSLDELTYIETLYGHQAGITGISCHGIRHEMPVSVARDRTARAWKLAEETHMIYRGGSKTSNADCITAIRDDYFLTGHDDGTLSMWLKDKKRPVETVQHAHGFCGASSASLPNGIVSCASLGGSDFVATGSNDGYLRLWQISTGKKNK